jgi:hypothetical protein
MNGSPGVNTTAGFGNPTPHYVSPNIGNYRVGRGFLKMQLAGDATAQDMGNCTQFEFQVKPTLLPHFSSRVGVRIKDYVAVTELEATLTMAMEEITARNFAIACLGTPLQSGATTIDIMSAPLIYASLIFTDTSAAGPQWNMTFPLTILSPAKATSLIAAGSGAWQTLDFTADVLKDPVTGLFGWATASDFT